MILYWRDSGGKGMRTTTSYRQRPRGKKKKKKKTEVFGNSLEMIALEKQIPQRHIFRSSCMRYFSPITVGGEINHIGTEH
jgi:hypothetical protein